MPGTGSAVAAQKMSQSTMILTPLGPDLPRVPKFRAASRWLPRTETKPRWSLVRRRIGYLRALLVPESSWAAYGPTCKQLTTKTVMLGIAMSGGPPPGLPTPTETPRLYTVDRITARLPIVVRAALLSSPPRLHLYSHFTPHWCRRATSQRTLAHSSLCSASILK